MAKSFQEAASTHPGRSLLEYTKGRSYKLLVRPNRARNDNHNKIWLGSRGNSSHFCCWIGLLWLFQQTNPANRFLLPRCFHFVEHQLYFSRNHKSKRFHDSLPRLPAGSEVEWG